jgi:hypothetical protein
MKGHHHSPTGRRAAHDVRLDTRYVGTVLCGACGDVVPDGAHILVSPYGPTHHIMYCPGCCPCHDSP